MVFLAVWPSRLLLELIFLHITIYSGQNWKEKKDQKALENEQKQADSEKGLTLPRRENMESVLHVYCS